MAKPLAEYRTSGGATVTVKAGWLAGYSWDCDGCNVGDQDEYDGAGTAKFTARSVKLAANTHANACRAIPRRRRNATHHAGATSARKD
jgi:hypothetical protein